MHEHRAARPHARAPADQVGAGRPVAMRAVHVEQVDLAGDRVQRVLRGQPHVAHPLRHARRRQVGQERLVVGLALGRGAVDLPRPAVVARMRVDRDDLDAVGRGAGEHDRRAAPVGADLDHHRRGAQLARARPQARRLGVGHPALDAAHRLERRGKSAHVRSGSVRARRPSASTAEAATHWSPKTTAAKPTRLLPPVESSSGSSTATTPST